MTMITVEGVYRDGRVEFPERPCGIGEPTPVLVTFLTPELAEKRDELARARESARLRRGGAVSGSAEQGHSVGRSTLFETTGAL